MVHILCNLIEKDMCLTKTIEHEIILGDVGIKSGYLSTYKKFTGTSKHISIADCYLFTSHQGGVC